MKLSPLFELPLLVVKYLNLTLDPSQVSREVSKKVFSDFDRLSHFSHNPGEGIKFRFEAEMEK